MKIGNDRHFFQLFETHAADHAEATALSFRGESWTYGQLNAQANRLANALLALWPDGKRTLALYMNRSPHLVAAIIGAMKSGNAYIPLDTEHPKERIRLILEEAAADLLVSEEELIPSLPADFPGKTDTLSVETLMRGGTSNPEFCPAPDDPVYILFTSGSTGRPKGVMIPHRGLDNFLNSMTAEPGITPADRLLAVTTVTFDISTLELFLPLSVGARVVLMDRIGSRDPEAITEAMDRHAITILQATPATWRMLIESGWTGRKNLKALCGGEALSTELAASLLSRCGGLWNMYGPTETSVWSTLARVEDPKDITVGHPIAHTTIRVLDESRREVPRGEIGEIHIGGAGLALGYLKRPDLTDKAFIEVDGERIYKTGDLGRLREDGRLECLGRIDFQVKIRGFRIELGDIESAILKMPGVKAALAHAHDFGSGEKELIAYVIPTGEDIAHTSLSAFLADRLPAYMVPACTVNLKAFPLNTNGKVERKALPVPELRAHPDPSSASANGDLKETLRRLWKEVLLVDDFTDDDDFFILGGNSILAVRMVGRIHRVLGMRIPLASFFRTPTIAGLAALKDAGTTQESGAIPLQEGGSGTPLFCLGGIGLYRELAATLGADHPVYGVFVPYEQKLIEHIQSGSKGGWAFSTVDGMAASYVEEIRKARPVGPYRLLGVSIAGFIAFAAAQRLVKAGERVEAVYVLDSHLQSSRRFSPAIAAKEALREMKRRVQRLVARLRTSGELGPEEIARRRDEVNRSAEIHFDRTAERYPGDLHLITAEEPSYPKQAFPPDLGWKRLVGGRLTISQVPGDHLGITRAPHVSRTAEVIRESQGNASSARP